MKKRKQTKRKPPQRGILGNEAMKQIELARALEISCSRTSKFTTVLDFNLLPLLSGGDSEAIISEAKRLIQIGDGTFGQLTQVERFYVQGVLFLAWNKCPKHFSQRDLHRFTTNRLDTKTFLRLIYTFGYIPELIRTLLICCSDSIVDVGIIIYELLSCKLDEKSDLDLWNAISLMFLKGTVPKEIADSITSCKPATFSLQQVNSVSISNWNCDFCSNRKWLSSNEQATFWFYTLQLPHEISKSGEKFDSEFISNLKMEEISELRNLLQQQEQQSISAIEISLRKASEEVLFDLTERNSLDLLTIHTQSFIDPIEFLTLASVFGTKCYSDIALNELINIGNSFVCSENEIPLLSHWISSLNYLFESICSKKTVIKSLFSSSLNVWIKTSPEIKSKMFNSFKSFRELLVKIFSSADYNLQETLKSLISAIMHGESLLISKEEDPSNVISAVQLFNKMVDGSDRDQNFLNSLSSAAIISPKCIIEWLLRESVINRNHSFLTLNLLSSLDHLLELSSPSSLIFNAFVSISKLATTQAKKENLSKLLLSLVGTSRIKPFDISIHWLLPTLSNLIQQSNDISTNESLLVLNVVEEFCKSLPKVIWFPLNSQGIELIRLISIIASDYHLFSYNLRTSAQKVITSIQFALSKASDQSISQFVQSMISSICENKWRWQSILQLNSLLKLQQQQKVTAEICFPDFFRFLINPENDKIFTNDSIHQMFDFILCCSFSKELAFELPNKLKQLSTLPILSDFVTNVKFRRNLLIALGCFLPFTTEIEFQNLISIMLPELFKCELLSSSSITIQTQPSLSFTLESFWILLSPIANKMIKSLQLPQLTDSFLLSFVHHFVISLSSFSLADPKGCFQIACILHSIPTTEVKKVESYSSQTIGSFKQQTLILCLNLAKLQYKNSFSEQELDSILSKLPQSDKNDIIEAFKK